MLRVAKAAWAKDPVAALEEPVGALEEPAGALELPLPLVDGAPAEPDEDADDEPEDWPEPPELRLADGAETEGA